MKLSDRDLYILSIAQYNADATAASIAKLSGTQEHVVRRLLSRLVEQEAISRLVYVNSYSLGFSEYIVFVNLSNPLEKAREQLSQQIARLSHISWLVELGGAFHFALGITARNGQDALIRFEKVVTLIGLQIREKRWVERIHWTYFGTRHLCTQNRNYPPIYIGEPVLPRSIDKLDHYILKEFCASVDGNISYIARSLGESANTIRHRIKRLKEKNILLGTVYHIDPEFFNKRRYRMLIYSQQLTSSFRSQIHEWAAKEQSVLTYVQNLGAWDVELRIEASSGQNANDLVSHFSTKFGSLISKVEVLPEFRYYKLENYTLDENSLPLEKQNSAKAVFL